MIMDSRRDTQMSHHTPLRIDGTPVESTKLERPWSEDHPRLYPGEEAIDRKSMPTLQHIYTKQGNHQSWEDH